MTPEKPSDPPRIVTSWGAWTDEGSGPVLLAIHGLPGNVRDFRWLGGALDGRLRLVRVDLPGFGRAPAVWRPGVSETVAYLDSVVETIGQKVWVAGHSFGSVYAAEYAASRPDSVEGLVMLAPLGLRKHRGFLKFPDPRILKFGLDLPVVGRVVEGQLVEGFERFGFKNVKGSECRRTIEILSRFDFDAHRRRIARVDVPSAVVWARDDHLIEPDISEELASALPDGPRLTFEEGGHNVQKSRAVEIVEALAEWM